MIKERKEVHLKSANSNTSDDPNAKTKEK